LYFRDGNPSATPDLWVRSTTPIDFTPQALGPINATSAEAGEKLRPKSTLVLVLFNGKVPSPTIRTG